MASVRRVAASPPVRRGSAALVVSATLASAVLLFFGTGLHPHSWLTWLAPLPLLLVVRHVPMRYIVVAAVVAGGVGGSNLWRYGTSTLSLPVPVVLGYVLGEGALLGLTAFVFGRLVRSGHRLAAAVCAPAVWVLGEALAARFSPNGAFLSLAYTQASWHPLLALVSLTGIWGLSYVIIAVPSGIAALAHSRGDRRSITWVSVWLVVMVALAGGYGLLYDANAAGRTGRALDVGLVVARQSYDPVNAAGVPGQQLLSVYRSAVTRLATSGAQLVVMPEKAFSVSSSTETAFVEAFRTLAASRHVTVIVGFVLDDTSTGGTLGNVAMAFPASGRQPMAYHKQHLVPSYESDFTPGDSLTQVKVGGVDVGLAICKDLDFPQVSRAYANSGAGLIAAPAWDFGDDAWLHSRIAVTAGVSTGVGIVRTTRDGALTVSDADGNVIAEGMTANQPLLIIQRSISSGSHDTWYDAWGDWFAWLCSVVAVVGLLGAARRSRSVGIARRGADVPADRPAVRGSDQADRPVQHLAG